MYELVLRVLKALWPLGIVLCLEEVGMKRYHCPLSRSWKECGIEFRQKVAIIIIIGGRNECWTIIASVMISSLPWRRGAWIKEHVFICRYG